MWPKVLNTHFFRENIELSNKHVKRCFTSLAMRKMQIKTMVKCHITSAKMAVMEMSVNTSVGRDGRNVNWYS